MKKIACFLCLIAIVACQEQKFEAFSQQENHYDFRKELELASGGILEFPLDNETGFWNYSIQYSDIEGKEYLTILNFLNNSILFYDYQKRVLEKKISMPYEGPHGVGALPQIASHLTLSPDSILIYNINLGRLFLVNDNAQVMKKYDIIDYRSDKISAPPQPGTLNPMINIGNEVYIPCALNQRLRNYDQYNTILKLNLENGKIDYLFPLPDIYNKGHWGEDFKYILSFDYNESSDEFIINYPVDPFLYKGNSEGNILSQQYVGSEYIDKIEPWKNDMNTAIGQQSDKTYQRQSEYSMSSSDYPGIIYDPYQELYYRIGYIRPSVDVVKTGYRMPDFSIIILNKSLEKLGEKRFSSKMYDQSMIFVSKKGINLARKDLHNQDENNIQFEFFSVRPSD